MSGRPPHISISVNNGLWGGLSFAHGALKTAIIITINDRQLLVCWPSSPLRFADVVSIFFLSAANLRGRLVTYIFGGDPYLSNSVRNLPPPKKRKLAAPKTSNFRRFREWIADREYLQKGTRYRHGHMENGVINRAHSRTPYFNSVNFDLKTANKRTRISTPFGVLRNENENSRGENMHY